MAARATTCARLAFAAVVVSLSCSLALAADPVLTQTQRGATVETDRYLAEFRDGVLVRLINKFTDEAYLDERADLAKVLPHLPSGLGTQHTEAQRDKAFELFHYPWWEHAVESRWPNQHYVAPDSAFAFQQDGPAAVTLTYTGLTDGTESYKDETFTLTLEVDKETGDLLVTPAAASPRPGVYGVNFTLAPLRPAITVEAPIFDGIRLDRDMKPMLWNVLWANYWDYQFFALNGWKKGAVGVWCQDAELKYYKSLYHMVNDQGLSLSVNAMNIPPFEQLKDAKPVTWRVQAFEKGWSEAAARFRDWRVKNVKIAQRPDWALNVSFVNMGVNAAPQWLDVIKVFFDNRNLDRTVTFAAVIRAEGFDKNHANNAPYEGFKEHMPAWKESGAKLMAYLNPVIMWSPQPKNEREEAGVRLAGEAKTIMPFRGPDAKPIGHFDVQHLGHPGWQRWFLDWVKEYIQVHGSDGVYHDEGQKTPLDNRGLINGMTTTMGRADYHYKTLAENPNSIHGVEHMTEVNNVGASLGIASGILWGTAGDMRHRRIQHASPVSNALHSPNGVLRAFPHYSEIIRGDALQFHWGMDLSEKRGEIAGHSLQNQGFYKGDVVPFEFWANEMWMDRTRSTTFVWEGLRPIFPVDWSDDVVTYFRSAQDGDFRYAKTPWGTAFVEVKDGQERMLYGRIHGVRYAQTGPGRVEGWCLYNADGPVGLRPDWYYVINPNASRPEAYFRTDHAQSESFYEGYAHHGALGEYFMTVDIRPIPQIGNITRFDSVVIVAPTEPAAVWVDGKPAKANPVVEKVEVVDGKRVVTHRPGEWKVGIQIPATVCVLLKAPPAGTADLPARTLLRLVSGAGEIRSDMFDTAHLSSRVLMSKDGTTMGPDNKLNGLHGAFYKEMHLPLALPEGAKKGVYRVTLTNRGGNPRMQGIDGVWLNGVPQRFCEITEKGTATVVTEIPLDEKNPSAVYGASGTAPTLKVEWIEDAPPAAEEKKQ